MPPALCRRVVRVAVFAVDTADGKTVTGARLLVTTGLVDELANIARLPTANAWRDPEGAKWPSKDRKSVV